MKRKLILVITVLVLVTGLGIACINIFVLPTKVKTFVIKSLEKSLNRKVEIETLHYLPLTTLSLKKLTVYRDDRPADVLLNIENAKFNFCLFPLLCKKKLISDLDIHNLSVKNLRLDGSVRTSLAPEPAGPFKLKGSVRLVNCSLKAGFLPAAIERFNGVIDLNGNGIQINNAYFYFKGANYKLKGGLENLNEPEINLSLTNSGKFNSEGKFLFKSDYIQIEKLNTQFENSTLDLIGDISNLNEPLLNLYGESSINIADLGLFFPEKKEDLKLEGICDAALFFKGGLNRLHDAEFGLKAKSDKLTVKDVTLNDFDMDLRMKNGLITTSKLSAVFYEGLISGLITAEPFSEGRPYSVEVSVQNASLAKWAKEVKYGKKIYGTLSSRFLLKGYDKSLDNLSGSGWATVTDGYLWEIPVLGGVANILSLPNLKSIVFREAAGNFSVGKRKINIHDLTFYSDTANLSVEGDIDFDTRLNLLITTNITQDIIQDSSDAAKIANILIQQAGQFLGTVKVRGTLKNPEYKIAPAAGIEPTKPIEKIFKEEIGDLLKDILE